MNIPNTKITYAKIDVVIILLSTFIILSISYPFGGFKRHNLHQTNNLL